MAIENQVKVRLADGREVWRITYVRYRDADSGKFIAVNEDIDVPGLMADKDKGIDLELIEQQILSTLTEIVAEPDLAARSSSSVRLLLGLVEKMKKEKFAAAKEEDWFILGRELAREVLALLEEDEEVISA